MNVNQISCYKFNSKPCMDNCRTLTTPVYTQSLKHTNENQNVSFTGGKAKAAGKALVGASTIGYAIVGFLFGGPLGAIIGGASGGAAAELIKEAADLDDD